MFTPIYSCAKVTVDGRQGTLQLLATGTRNEHFLAWRSNEPHEADAVSVDVEFAVTEIESIKQDPVKHTMRVHLRDKFTLQPFVFDDGVVQMRAFVECINEQLDDTCLIESPNSGLMYLNPSSEIMDQIQREHLSKQPVHQRLLNDYMPTQNTVDAFKWNILNGFARVTKVYRDTVLDVASSSSSSTTSPLLAALHPQTHVNAATNAMSELKFRGSEDFEEITMSYFHRWARQVQDDTDKWVADAKWKNRVKKQSRANGNSVGLSLLLDGDLIVEMETTCGQFELISKKIVVEESDSQPDKTEPLKPLEKSEWLKYLAAERLKKPDDEYFQRLFTRGLDKSVRPSVWALLLQVTPWDSTVGTRRDALLTSLDAYRRLKKRWTHPVEDTVYQEILEERRHRVEKDVVRIDRGCKFYSLVDESVSTVISDEDHGSSAYIQAEIDKYSNIRRLRDILVTLSLYRLDTGYVQGMSDLASPIFAALESFSETSMEMYGIDASENPAEAQDIEESLAFWMLISFLHRHAEVSIPGQSLNESPQTAENHISHNLVMNFHSSQKGMRSRLILFTYLTRLLANDVYVTLSLLEDPPSLIPASSKRRPSVSGGGGVMGMLWIFKTLLVCMKRDLCSDSSLRDGAPDKYFDSVWKLWDGMLVGWARRNLYMDVWLTFGMIMTYIAPTILGSTHRLLTDGPASSLIDANAGDSEMILSFEDLLMAVSALNGQIDVGKVLHETQTQMQRLKQRINLLPSLNCLTPSFASDEDQLPIIVRAEKYDEYWHLNEQWCDRTSNMCTSCENPSTARSGKGDNVRITVYQALKLLNS